MFTQGFGRYAATFGVVAIMLACTSSTSSSKPSGQPEAVTFRLISDWTTLDLQKALTVNVWQITSAFYDTLVTYDNAGKLTPYLATSWKTSPGSATFTLRTDAVCADGTPVTADVVANSFKRLFADSTKSTIIKGRFGGVGPFGATKDDATHVTITTGGKNTVDLVYAASHPGTGIVCPAGLLPGADFEKNSFGSGPYTMTSATHGDSVVAALRPSWKWGPRGVTSATLPKTLTMKVVVNETTAANLLVTGGLDISTVAGSDVTRLRAEKSLNNFQAASPWAHFIIFNQTPKRLGADPLVRQALATAVDRKAWNIAANAGFGEAATGILAPATACFDPTATKLLASYDLAKAAALLKQAGWVLGSDNKLTKDGQPMKLVLAAPTSMNSGPDYVAEQWTKLGVSVTLNKKQQVDWVGDLRSGNFDAAPFPIGDANNVPIGNLTNFIGQPPPAGTNLARIFDPTFEQAFVAATNASEADRCNALGALQRAMVATYDFVPLANQQTQWFSRGLKILPAAINAFDFTTIQKT
jgi:peptide/nickel transport system substrate-binding protein